MKKLKFNKHDNEYIDLYNNITHLKFVKNKKEIYLPIRPCKIDNQKTYKLNIDIPKINLDRFIRVLSIKII